MDVLDASQYSCTVGNQQSSINNGWAPPNTRESSADEQRGRWVLRLTGCSCRRRRGRAFKEIRWGRIEMARPPRFYGGKLQRGARYSLALGAWWHLGVMDSALE
jgi:hypothetical protein